MAELTCPECKGHRIAQTTQAVVEYLVYYDTDTHDVEIDEPANIRHGHVQYELMGPWESGVIYCVTTNEEGLVCGHEGSIEDFIVLCIECEEPVSPESVTADGYGPTCQDCKTEEGDDDDE